MAATRVRVLFEFRNGNNNYLSYEGGDADVWSDCKGKDDLGALDAAYLAALQGLGLKRKKIREHLEKHIPPSHD